MRLYKQRKDLQIGYSLPEHILKNTGIGRVNIYVAGTNLLTFSPFKYWDPEKGSGNGLSYPLQRTFNLGFQFNF